MYQGKFDFIQLHSFKNKLREKRKKLVYFAHYLQNIIITPNIQIMNSMKLVIPLLFITSLKNSPNDAVTP